MTDRGYINYFDILELDDSAKPGDIRKSYRKVMKALVQEIARVEITDERRSHYLLEMAKYNAALFVLRDNALRETYWAARQELIRLEEEWRCASDKDEVEKSDSLRRVYDGKLRQFLMQYVEGAMLDAGRDKECVEASHWDAAHERHASRLLRHYRQNLYQEIHERLPYYDVTPPKIDWGERTSFVDSILKVEARG